MRIFVTGSTGAGDPQAIDSAFTQACRELGAALARAGHSLIAGSDRVGVADRYVLEGVNSVEGRHRVSVYRPEQGDTPYGAERDTFKHIEFQYEGRQRGTWTVARVAQILAADGIIVIGGTEGTSQIGYTAPLLGRPVLAIPAFGGAARDIWTHLERDYQRVPSLRPMLGKIREAWSPESAETVVRAIGELVKHNPYRMTAKGLLPLMVALSAGLLGAWVGLFFHPLAGHNVSFFLLLGLAALAGTMLRNTLRLLDTQGSLTGRTIALEATVALLLAFGLALAYMAGGLTITGTPDFLALQKASDYQRIGIVMSLLGLGAGFLIEEGASRLRRVLNQAFTDREQS